jgi:hypothetical protein
VKDATNDDDDDGLLKSSEDNDHEEIIIKGVPSYPLYRELANRLFRWERDSQGCVNLMVSAESLGLNECLTYSAIPFRPTFSTIDYWLQKAGDRGIVRMLGMRTTVGNDSRPLLPPSRRELLLSAGENFLEQTSLTVSARARAKHAHRSSNSFFGEIRGNFAQQNTDTMLVIWKILLHAVWLNIHRFGGLPEGVYAFEARIHSGYGARWTGEWMDLIPTNVKFRGFLEPQMPDGHERHWRH